MERQTRVDRGDDDAEHENRELQRLNVCSCIQVQVQMFLTLLTRVRLWLVIV